MAIHKTCDGVQRRDFLRVGVAGMAGMNLASYLSMAEAGELAQSQGKNAIFVNLNGGPSHMDTFDLKPDAPTEYRGIFNPIKTNVNGVEFSEHLPNLAKCADKFAIFRGVSHTLGAHRLGTEYVNTGNRPLASLEYPGYGAVVTKELSEPTDIPQFVAIPRSSQRAGFLGVRYAPLNTGRTPTIGSPFSVRGVSLGSGLTVTEVKKRKSLLNDLDSTFAGAEQNSQLLEGLDEFSKQAHAMITSPRSRQAFDISKESDAFSAKFGESSFGASCLLATRLVEAGVKFVTLTYGGWDTHRDNFTSLKDRQLPSFDQGLAGLFVGLEEKGLLDSTVVYVTGEFGRTPKINSRTAEGGRDHYPRCMFMLMAGGGVRGGQVIGKSDEKATAPVNEAITPDDVAATFYQAMGIDHLKEYHTSTGRPIMIVRDGTPIAQAFA
ncbi:MAG: hypothetical protein CMJ79_02210 [Planctomycetaceae bacterium]|nr:hypothetical protein [Planctomycetaceae bacterium]|tara:strand:+ start:2901 stop:4205 length:1305 start_codon:yes stop_codon:yes gene_type:complete